MTEEQQKKYAESSFTDEEAMWDEVYRIAEEEGVIIVQAAGNSNVLAALDPMKRSKSTIVVGATDKSKRRANFSNYGSDVDIYAPGAGIYSSVPNEKFAFMDGTSMASPIVAGCVGLIKSVNDTISIESIKTLLIENGSNVENSRGKLIHINDVISKIK